jgi:signal transduction histidine kinase
VTVTAEPRGAAAAITVTDTGIGIAPEDVAKLFQRFSRIQTAETRDIEGTGLGLYIVKELTDRMQGTIEVQSAKGVGTSFVLTLPAVPPGAKA